MRYCSSLDAAESAFRAALGHKADFVPSLVGLTEAVAAQNRHQEAQELLEVVAGHDPGQAAALRSNLWGGRG